MLTICQAVNRQNQIQKQVKARDQTSSHFQSAADCVSLGPSCQPEKRILTVRQAANQRYEIQKQERARMKLKMKTRQGKYGRPEPVLIASREERSLHSLRLV